MEFRFPKAAGRTASRTAAFGSMAALAIVLAGCSSSGQQTAASGGGSTAPKAQSSAAAKGGVGQGGMPGVFGLIAEIDGSTMQVQSQSDQTAVSFNSKTSIEQIKTASAKDLATGWCATVVSSTKSASPGTTPSKITATSVSLTKATGSSCGFGGGRTAGGQGTGQRPSGAPSNFPGGGKFPSGQASRRPVGSPSGRAANLGTFATGKITKVAGSGFVMDAMSRGANSTSTPSTQPVTVTVSKSTKLTMQESAKSSAIKQGECVRANGKTDDTGAVTATSLTLSSAVKGQCTETGGFGGFGGFGGQQGGSGSNG